MRAPIQEAGSAKVPRARPTAKARPPRRRQPKASLPKAAGTGCGLSRRSDCRTATPAADDETPQHQVATFARTTSRVSRPTPVEDRHEHVGRMSPARGRRRWRPNARPPSAGGRTRILRRDAAGNGIEFRLRLGDGTPGARRPITLTPRLAGASSVTVEPGVGRDRTPISKIGAKYVPRKPGTATPTMVAGRPLRAPVRPRYQARAETGIPTRASDHGRSPAAAAISSGEAAVP